jgi:hypothetical protein
MNKFEKAVFEKFEAIKLRFFTHWYIPRAFIGDWIKKILDPRHPFSSDHLKNVDTIFMSFEKIDNERLKKILEVQIELIKEKLEPLLELNLVNKNKLLSYLKLCLTL